MLNFFHKWLNSKLLIGADPVKVRLLTNYSFYATLFGLVYSGFYLHIDFLEGFYIINVTIFILVLLPFLFLKTSNHIIVANLFLVMAWFVVFSIGSLTGGLYSNITPWLAFIIITSVLLTDVNNSLLWLLVIIITILGFYLLLEEPFSIKVAYNTNYAPFYYCIGYIGFCILIFITAYLFHNELAIYVDQLEVKGHDLRRKNVELEESHALHEIKNKELQEANEEIVSQTEKIKEVNDNLEFLIKKRTNELEKRNLQLEEYAHMNAHHLRAPICTTLGIYNLLEHPNLKEEDLPELMNRLKQTIKELNRVTKEVTKVINV